MLLVSFFGYHSTWKKPCSVSFARDSLFILACTSCGTLEFNLRSVLQSSVTCNFATAFSFHLFTINCGRLKAGPLYFWLYAFVSLTNLLVDLQANFACCSNRLPKCFSPDTLHATKKAYIPTPGYVSSSSCTSGMMSEFITMFASTIEKCNVSTK